MLWGTECADHFIAEHSQFCVTLNPTGTDMLSSAMEVATNGFQLCQYMFTKCVYVFVCCVYMCVVFMCMYLCLNVCVFMYVCVFIYVCACISIDRYTGIEEDCDF